MRLLASLGVFGALSCLVAAGCGDDGDGLWDGADDLMDDHPPSGMETLNPTADTCTKRVACGPALYCAAPFFDGVRGFLTCASACVATQDETRFCGRDDACCDPNARCTDRGFCEVPASPDDTTSGTSA